MFDGTFSFLKGSTGKGQSEMLHLEFEQRGHTSLERDHIPREEPSVTARQGPRGTRAQGPVMPPGRDPGHAPLTDGQPQGLATALCTRDAVSPPGSLNVSKPQKREIGEMIFNKCRRCCSAKSCPGLRDPMDSSVSGLPVLHHLPEFPQTHVH